MIETLAKISKRDKTDGEYVWVETEKKSVCGNCARHSSCGTPILEKLFNKNPVSVKIHNSLNAKDGDEVIIGLSENAFLKGSFFLYFFPLIGIIFFAGIGVLLTITLKLSSSSADLTIFAFSLLGFLSSGYLCKKLKHMQYEVKLLKIVKNHQVLSSDGTKFEC